MKNTRKLALQAIALAATLAASHAQAFEFDGYFRTGPGATKKNVARACYRLPNATFFRLGNECDFYGEFGLSHSATVGTVAYKAKIMISQGGTGTDVGDKTINLNQMYVEGKGFDIAPSVNFWIGKRFHERSIVHITDGFYTNLSGVGAGAEIPLASGDGAPKLGFSYFGTDGNDKTGAANTSPGFRLNAYAADLPVNPGGTLRVTGTYVKGNFNNATDGKGTDGLGISAEHTQKIDGIGSNSAFLQYAQGSAGLDSSFATLTAKSSKKSFRVVDAFTLDLGDFTGQALFLYANNGKDNNKDGSNDPAAKKSNELAVGARAAYAFTTNFKLVSEAGYTQLKPQGGSTQKLAKFTIAPTLTTGKGFFNRPELRLYVTTAKWNNPANEAAGANGIGGLSGKRTGTSYGFQAEVWF